MRHLRLLRRAARTGFVAPARSTSAHRKSLSSTAIASGAKDSGAKSVCYDDHLSAVSRARAPSAIRALHPLMAQQPEMISLGGGMPHPDTFPVDGLSFSVKGQDAPLELTPRELGAALQYSPTPGLPALNALLRGMLVAEHAPPLAAAAGDAGPGYGVVVTTGSQEAVGRAFDMLLDPGDSVLVEAPTYSGTLTYLAPLDVAVTAVPTDANGLVPEALAHTLETWDADARGGAPKPRVLYTVPTGGNPSGACLPEGRRRAVYAIARAHDLIVLEDDPYYYLQYRDAPLPSFASMDVDGRVVRFDSFSKVLSAGLRLGFASGPAPLMDRLSLHGQATTLHPSGLSQALVLKLLERWGPGGFAAHVSRNRALYAAQRDAFLAAADRHLTGRATWKRDVGAGMFAWIDLHGVEDSQELVARRAVEAKVLFVPGAAFLPPDHGPTSFVRASFSSASPEDMDAALERLASLLPDGA